MATLVLAFGKALALTLRIVLIVVLALAWRLVGALNQVRYRTSRNFSTRVSPEKVFARKFCSGLICPEAKRSPA